MQCCKCSSEVTVSHYRTVDLGIDLLTANYVIYIACTMCTFRLHHKTSMILRPKAFNRIVIEGFDAARAAMSVDRYYYNGKNAKGSYEFIVF